jgi:hypothetical protein
MKKNHILCIIAFTVISANAQVTTFLNTVGGPTNYDYANSIQQTTDGGYITAGMTASFGAGNTDIYVVKTDSTGTQLWTKTYGGTMDEQAYGIQQTTDGGYIIAGTTNSFGSGGDDVYLIKTDINGILTWSKTFGGVNGDLGYSVQQTTDGGYIVGGYRYETVGNYNYYLIKTDASGTLLWTKTFGGSGADHGMCVIQTADGGYVIAGDTYSFGLQGGLYVVKTDSNGTESWSKTYGNYMGGNEKIVIQQTADGGYVICTSNNELGDYDACVIKTDGSGNVTWATNYDMGSTGERGYTVKQASDGGYIIGGSAGSVGAYLIKTSTTGAVQWSKTYYAYSVRGVTQTTDGGFVATGIGFSNGSDEVLLLKVDANGNSFCNDSTQTAITGSPSMVYGPCTSVSSSGGVVANANTLTGTGGTTTSSCSSVGINNVEQETNSISIYPNPSKSIIYIKILESVETNTQIVDINGKVILESKEIQIAIDSLPAGIYSVLISTKNGRVAKRLVKY